MRKFAFILVCLSLTQVKCVNEECHRQIILINQSTENIVQALKIKDTSGNCFLTGSILQPGESYEYTNRSCYEDILSAGETFEFFIIDPNHYNTPGIFYDCNSIESENTILKHYSLTLKELELIGFTISYP